MDDNMDLYETMAALRDRMDAVAADIEERRLKIFSLSIEVEELKAMIDGRPVGGTPDGEKDEED